jgi:predicted phosphodiesterase
MRVIVTSDTHYHRQWQRELEVLVEEIAACEPDCLVVGGDIGEHIDGYRKMLELFQRVACPRLIITGNHDLWARDGIRSDRLWLEVLPALTRESGAIWLEGENWSRNGLGICGTNGWYDYSARDPSIPLGEGQYSLAKGLRMADAWYVKWDWTDIEFANTIGDAFSARLAGLDADPDIREILVVTHVPAFEEGVVRKPGDLGWNVSNAYFGNLTLGKRIIQSRKVTRVISGHTHVGREATITGAGGPIDMRVLASDYGAPVYVVLDYQ